MLFSLFGQHIFDFEEEIEISLAFIAFEHKVTETELRLACGVLFGLLIGWIFLRDYSAYFPKLLRMTVRFDDAGVQRLLESYQADPRFPFDIYSDWRKPKRDFLTAIEREVYAKTEEVLDIADSTQISGKGSTTFVVKKQSIFSQSYCVAEADGQLTLRLTTGESDLVTIFHLQETYEADIRVSLFDILFRHTFFTGPRFSQTYRINPLNEIRFDDLIALTKARFFPAALVGESLYLMKEKQRWFPVAYCRYEY